MINSHRRTRLPPSLVLDYGREAIIFHPRILLSLVSFLILFNCGSEGVPIFDEFNRMAFLLLPGDAEVNTIIYRLRAEDSDRRYPLQFDVQGHAGIDLIYIETDDCHSSTDIFCEANVFLRRPLEVGRVYNFNLTVTDRRGSTTEIISRVHATNGLITPASVIFTKYTATIEIKEDVPVKSVISQMTVRMKQEPSSVEFLILGDTAQHLFEMQMANVISEHAINGTLILKSPVDFEEAYIYTFKVCILHPFTNEIVDTRNIACIMLSVVVIDVQDEPPIFITAPPITRVLATATPGDKLTQVEAKDRDRGAPRSIRYTILSNEFIHEEFFAIDSISGIITIKDAALEHRESVLTLDPILISVTATEITNHQEIYPTLTTSVEIAFVIIDSQFLNPKFVAESYIGEVFENALQETQVSFTAPFLVKNVKGLFALEIKGGNGAFSVSPNIVKDSSDIAIRIKNSFLLDFEKEPQLQFQLIASQIRGRTQASSTTDVTVRILDANDNPPVFSMDTYEVAIYENIVRGTTVLRVTATDIDSGNFGVVRYTNLFGPGSESLLLEPTTGIIKCITDNHIFDREASSEFIITVEAKDNDGQGMWAINIATARVIIRLKDVNDSPPKFEEPIYKGVLAPDLQGLRDSINIKAVDADADRPNNQIVYEIEHSSYSDYFTIGKTTGILDVSRNFASKMHGLNSQKEAMNSIHRAFLNKDTVISLRVRASDLGEPPLSEWVDVKIFKKEFGERVIRFIYPKSPSEVRNNRQELEGILNILTGGSTEILDVQPSTQSENNKRVDYSKSNVTVLVRFGLTTTIDVERLTSSINSSQLSTCNKCAVVIRTLEDQNTSYVVSVVLLCIVLSFFMLLILFCCCCEGCPLYKSNQENMIPEDDSDGAFYVRVDANSPGSHKDPGWWSTMPYFLKVAIMGCGYKPPGVRRSPLSSAATSIRHFDQAPERILGSRGGRIVQVMHLEDLDTGRIIPGLAPISIAQSPTYIVSLPSHIVQSPTFTNTPLPSTIMAAPAHLTVHQDPSPILSLLDPTPVQIPPTTAPAPSPNFIPDSTYDSDPTDNSLTRYYSDHEVNNLNSLASIRDELLINNNSNLADEDKIQSEILESGRDKQKMRRNEILSTSMNSTDKNDPKSLFNSLILSTGKAKVKPNRMMEKKSIFTIAYDGIKTEKIRPHSSASCS